jgi:hypothetical protein
LTTHLSNILEIFQFYILKGWRILILCGIFLSFFFVLKA